MSSIPLESLNINQEQVSSFSERILIKPRPLFLKIVILFFSLMTLLGATLLTCAALGVSPGLILSIIGLVSVVVGLSSLVIFIIWFVSSTTKKVEGIAYDFCTKQDQDLSRIRELETENRNLRAQDRYEELYVGNLLLQDENRRLFKEYQIFKNKFSLENLEDWKEDIRCIIEQSFFIKLQCKEEIMKFPLEEQRLFLYPQGFRFLVDRMAPRSRFFQTPKYEYNSKDGDLVVRKTAVYSRLKKEFFSAVLGACTYEEVKAICTRVAELSTTSSVRETLYDVLINEFPNLLVAESLWLDWCKYSYPYLRPLSSTNCAQLLFTALEQMNTDLFVDGSEEDRTLARLFSFYNDHIPAVLASFSLPLSSTTGGSVFAFLPRKEPLRWSDLEIMTQRYLRDTFIKTKRWTGSIEAMLCYYEYCFETADTSRQTALKSQEKFLREGVESSIEIEEVAVSESGDDESEDTWIWDNPLSDF